MPHETPSSPQAPQLAPIKPLPPLPLTLSPSRSAPGLDVGGLVSRFNTLDVVDRDEERNVKQIKKLESALRRAEMAREEAETEAKNLRKEVKSLKREVEEFQSVGEEWVEEKERLKRGLGEYEVSRRRVASFSLIKKKRY